MLVVSRTFSKIYALAGLRIGYVIGKPDLIKKIDKYHMGIANNQAALAAGESIVGRYHIYGDVSKKNAEASQASY
jgi:histidinol-phosphate aminotransferase